jgi:hypothetical protein
MVFLGAACMMLAVATAGLSGCPALGIGGKAVLGKIVVHNNFKGDDFESIISVSAVRVPDECSNQEPKGVNILPEAIPAGKLFEVSDLPEGRYYCECSVLYYVRTNHTEGHRIENGYLTIAAGGTADWYVQ